MSSLVQQTLVVWLNKRKCFLLCVSSGKCKHFAYALYLTSFCMYSEYTLSNKCKPLTFHGTHQTYNCSFYACKEYSLIHSFKRISQHYVNINISSGKFCKLLHTNNSFWKRWNVIDVELTNYIKPYALLKKEERSYFHMSVKFCLGMLISLVF